MSEPLRPLIDRALAGDQRAAAELVVKHLKVPVHTGISGYCYCYLPWGSYSRKDIEDATQEVMIRLLVVEKKLLQNWDPDRLELRRYVRFWAFRRAKDYFRPRRRERIDLAEPSSLTEHGDDSAARAMVERQDIGPVLEAVKEDLGEGTKAYEFFCRLFLEEQSPEKICADTRISRSRLDAWRYFLRKRFASVWEREHAG